jgi:plastocyanin
MGFLPAIIALLSSAGNAAGKEPMPALPRVLFVIPGILAGILVPTLIVSAPKAAPADTIGMTFMDFSKDVVYLHQGQYLTLVNSSRNIHAVGPGNNGQVISAVRGEPMTGYHMMETNAVYKTGPWQTPGTYYVTCSIHPMMNLTVVVLS